MSHSFETGAVLLLISTATVKIVGALFKIPLSNLLGDTGFGYFSAVYDLFTPFYALAMSGFPVAAARIISAYHTDGKSAEIRCADRRNRLLFWGIGFAATALFCLFIPLLKSLVSVDGQSEAGFWAVAPSILFFFGMSAYRGYYEGLHNMIPTAVSDLIEALLKLALGYGFAVFAFRKTGNALTAASAALLGITVGVAAATLYLALRRKTDAESGTVPETAAENRRVYFKKFLKILIPIALTALLTGTAISLADALTVQPILKHGGCSRNVTALYGIRSKAYTLFNLVPAITTAIGVSAVPQLSAAYTEKDSAKLRRQSGLMLRLSALISVPAGIGLTAMSRPIMRLLYGAGSESVGGKLLFIYGIAAVFAGITVPVVHALQAVSRQRAALTALGCGLAVKILLNFVLIGIPKISIYGAAISTALAFAVSLIFALRILYVTVNPEMPLLSWLKPILASVGCVVAGIFGFSTDSSVVTVLLMSAAAICYFLLIFAFRYFTAEELSHFPVFSLFVRPAKK